MLSKKLHIIAFDIPYPADYGGVIDIFNKVKSFKEAGVKVILHCYEYGREPSSELKKICDKVYYYKRNMSKANLFNIKPYIVVTRSSEELMKNLLKDNAPILFEGLHTCYFLDDDRLSDRKKIVRTHNIEHIYYLSLSKTEKNLLRKYYYLNESYKLKFFESILEKADIIAAISKNDYLYFSEKYKNVYKISAFHPNNEVNIKTGKGDYALYHGSLGVNENNEAALFLINNIFNDLDIKLIIAGNKPSTEVKEAVFKNKNIKLINNIKTEEIYKLIREAQINILPTFQSTGIKLKLLAAIYNGRHCIVNTEMVKNTGLEELCSIKDNETDIKNDILKLFKEPFTDEDIQKRETILNSNGFSNSVNINELINIIF